ncbi:MAG TPA: hypothetical protein VK832_00140 [Burkholderiaceae bacterium]|jgi:hypothetical protein|nr:hypothetical protein [Burkholderiaceae bacterium]
MSTYKLNGGCHCGNVRVELTLTGAPAACIPRVCDCDFCRKHGASYISDPQGTLQIDVKEERDFGKYKQGSGVSDCLICRQCGVLVGFSYREEGRLYATINRRVVEGEPLFGAEISVSPKLLSEGKKTERWKEKWFREVAVHVHHRVPA